VPKIILTFAFKNFLTILQSEISRAYVTEMENELEKNPRGAAQAVIL
jgi:hypothetical protein